MSASLNKTSKAKQTYVKTSNTIDDSLQEGAACEMFCLISNQLGLIQIQTVSCVILK